MKPHTILKVSFFSFLFPFLLYPEKNVSIENVPQWVSVQHIPAYSEKSHIDRSEGVLYLLADEQYEIASESYYQHYARKILTSGALQNETKLTMVFDPTYQQLVVHYVRVHRGNETIDLLDDQEIRVIQQEKSLEYDLYDGRLTAVLLLEDIRVGDILEYATTTIGENPIFEGKFLGGFSTQWTLPVVRIFFRMIVPHGRKIDIAYHERKISPSIKTLPDGSEYVWQENNVVAIKIDPDLPSWYNPYPWIQLSEFHSWNDVSQWASNLFSLSETEIKALQRTVDELSKKSGSSKEYICKALRFVQDDIRYFGVEIGINSHQPNNPSKVLKQRFGDCKDKTLLFCALLRGKGIDASPVLVNSQLLKEVEKMHPSPLAFNHVVACVKLYSGEYFFDPTLNQQRGLFDLLTFPAALKGLVVEQSASDLIDIDDHSDATSRSEIQEYYQIKDFSSPAVLKVSSTFYGNKATMIRSWYTSMSAQEREQFGMEYYTKQYYNVVTVQPMNIVLDDEESNILVTQEEYLIDSLWQYSDEEERLEAVFHATLMRERFAVPRAVKRTTPLGTNHPSSLHFNIRVDLPEWWTIPDAKTEIEDPAFTFTSSVHSLEHRVEIEYRYITKRDYVPPELVREYSENVNKALNEIGYSLYKYDRGSAVNVRAKEPGAYWFFYMILFAGLIGAGVLAFPIWKMTTPNAIDEHAEEKFKQEISESKMTLIPSMVEEKFFGIKGWLFLPAFHLIIYPLLVINEIELKIYPIFKKNSWDALTSVENDNPLYGPLMIGDMLVNLSVIIASIIVAFFFFRKKQQAPRYMIAWYAVVSVLPIAEVAILSLTNFPALQIFEMSPLQIAWSIISIAIAIPYFLKSQRVKDTFIY